MTPRPLLGRRALLASLVAGLLVGLVPGIAAPARPSAIGPGLSTTADFVNVSTTSSYSFQPATFYVYPGAIVHLAVTQLAGFAHTFTLSSVRNGTIPPGDNATELYQFFRTNPPIVNLSLPGTVGFVNSTTFVAPAIGTYEFVCTEPGHFQSGMKGFMYSTTSPPAASSTSSLPTTTYIILGIGVGAVVIGLAVVLAVRHRRTARPPPSP